MNHVLLVDDDPKILDLVAAYLRGHHFEVSTAGMSRCLDSLKQPDR